MTKRVQSPPRSVTWEAACRLLEEALRGPLRQDFLTDSMKGRDFAGALKRLRSAMRNHLFKTPATTVDLGDVVRTLDQRSQQEGFHVLKEWDQVAAQLSQEDVPILMLDYFAMMSSAAHQNRKSLAVLLDYYFLYVLALVVLRGWDEGDPNQNLDRVNGLLRDLQGPGGSGQRFIEDAATLLFVATSNFQPDETAYPRLLERVWTLDESHRVQVAKAGGPVLGTHLRWALTAIYERDLVRMRDDNAIDYPWLFFSVVILLREYARLRGVAGNGAQTSTVEEAERSRVTDALLNALSADPWAFVETPPPSLERYVDERAELRRLLTEHMDALLKDLEAHSPSDGRYSPISLQFNFPHNAVVSIVALALLATLPLPNLPFDALLYAPPRGSELERDTEMLAKAVTGYAAAHPEQRGDRRVLIVAYNPPLGLRSYTRTISALKKTGAA